ncbi:MAG: eCIS core domain-containing protein, partial [Chloroflexota bacterium]
MAPVVRRMMERALGATFADVRVHAGSTAGGAAQALGAQAFTMGSDIYFASGKFDPAAPAGLALLAHELTHTRQRAAVPLRKAVPGARTLAAGEGEPAHLEAEAAGTEAAVLRAFSEPARIPMLSRMVAGSYEALGSDREPSSKSIWSGFTPRPALSGGGAGPAMAEGLAAWTARTAGASLIQGGSPVQRQAAVAGLSSSSAAGSLAARASTAGSSGSLTTSPSAAGSSTASPSPMTAASPTAGSTTVAQDISPAPAPSALGATASLTSSSPSQATAPISPFTPASALSGPAARGAASAAGPSVQRQASTGLPVAGAAGTGATGLAGIPVGASLGSAARPLGEAGGVGPFLQRFATGGTLLGDLGRRREGRTSPGAITLSPIFSPSGPEGMPRVQRRALASYTLGAGASGLAAFAGGM